MDREPYHTRETPPRTWGRLVSFYPVLVSLGNTPTHVGKTGRERYTHTRARKHPHARGEDQKLARNLLKSEETPPRTWGRLLLREGQLLFLRNTPTHVGKTSLGRVAADNAGKHPHARGEDQGRLYVLWPLSGNTPTHVGKTV